MKMVLKRLIIKNFKGIKEFTVDFSEKVTKICGQNGSGKTSVATAWHWLWADRDYDLNANPMIRPDDAEDGDMPLVEAEIEVDGKPIVVSKYQKFKRSKPDKDGITKTSTTNGYEINSVEYSARDFEKRLSEDFGVDFEKFLQLSHPNVFVSGMKDKKNRDAMRVTLFAMADGVSDKELAESDPELSDLAELLGNYRADEVEAMQRASMRKINEVYGKDGEIIDAEIRGLQTAKTDVSVDELTNKQHGLEGRIAELDKEIASGKVDISDLEIELAKIGVSIKEYEASADEILRKKRSKLKDSLADAEREVKDKKHELATYNDSIVNASRKIAEGEARIEELRVDYNETKCKVMSDNATVCPACGREFEPERIEEIKKAFDEERASKLKQIDAEASGIDKQDKDLGADIEKWQEKMSIINRQLDTIYPLIENIEKELAGLPDVPDYTESAGYVNLIERKDAIEVSMAEKVAQGVDTTESELLRDRLKAELQEVIEEIGRVNGNTTIDDKIEALRQKKVDLAQQRADCEKILHQLSILAMKKNLTLEDQVNKHFEIVKWKLFDIQKNGEVKDACIPFIDGYRFGQSTNTGRELLAKLDIINGLQRFYETYLPVFVDGTECLSEVTESRIQMDCQAIFLKVSEDNELRFM